MAKIAININKLIQEKRLNDFNNNNEIIKREKRKDWRKEFFTELKTASSLLKKNLNINPKIELVPIKETPKLV